MTGRWHLRALLLLAVVAGAVACGNTMTGPSATPTPTGSPTPTPSVFHNVYVGRNASGSPDIVFPDSVSGTSTSTIRAGEAVQWIWANGSHSTTSGTCPLGCISDGQWNSGVGGSGTYFQHTFPVAGTFPYFCSVHGPMMQGKVIVQ